MRHRTAPRSAARTVLTIGEVEGGPSSERFLHGVLAPWDAGIRFESHDVHVRFLKSPYPLVRWTDRWEQRPGRSEPTRSGFPKAGPAAMAAKASEPPELTYMRQTRNAVVFIAVIVGIVCALSLIGAIVVGSQLSKMNSQLSQLGGGSTSSNCYSQGGTDLSC